MTTAHTQIQTLISTGDIVRRLEEHLNSADINSIQMANVDLLYQIIVRLDVLIETINRTALYEPLDVRLV